jgi:hypothetical protein
MLVKGFKLQVAAHLLLHSMRHSCFCSALASYMYMPLTLWLMLVRRFTSSWLSCAIFISFVVLWL